MNYNDQDSGNINYTHKLRGETQMAYNAENAKETQGIPAATKAEGIVIDIQDGKTKDFVQNLENWKGDPNRSAINLIVEVRHGETSFKVSKLFNYEDKEVTEYTSNSNLGKYKKYYNKLPQVGDRVKVLTNAEGFFRLLIE